MNAADFTDHFDEVAQMAQSEPIMVLHAGRPVGVFLSPAEYEQFTGIDDGHRAALADAAVAREHFLSAEESLCWVEQRLNREG
ncbi:MAG: hypothetical protein ACRC33_31150 [Gemmataceae bacterium]